MFEGRNFLAEFVVSRARGRPGFINNRRSRVVRAGRASERARTIAAVAARVDSTRRAEIGYLNYDLRLVICASPSGLISTINQSAGRILTRAPLYRGNPERVLRVVRARRCTDKSMNNFSLAR